MIAPPTVDVPSLSSLLPYHSFDPHGCIFLHADGSLGLIWRLNMLETEVASERQLEEMAIRIESSLRLLPVRSASQFLLMVDRDVHDALSAWTKATVREGVYRELARFRGKAIQNIDLRYEGAPFVARRLQLYVTLRIFPEWSSTQWFQVVRGAYGAPSVFEQTLVESYSKHARDILKVATALEDLWSQMGVSSRRLDSRDLIALCRRILNPGGTGCQASVDCATELLCDQVARSHLTFDFSEGVIALNGFYHVILSCADVPRETWPGMLLRSGHGGLGALDYVPETLLTLNMEVCDSESIQKFLHAKKRLAFCQLSSGDVKVDLASMKEEVDGVLGEMFEDGARVLSVRMHWIVRDPDRNEVHRRAQEAINALSRIGITVVEEDALALTLFLQSLPLAYDYVNDRSLKRGRKMVSLNLAHLIPLYGAFQGTSSPDLLLLNRHGEPMTFSFFDSDVAPHGIVAGVSGSGKSVFVNHLILSALRRGSHVFVLDRGNSYQKLCQTLGGTYVTFDPDRPMALNPCGHDLTHEKHLFLTDIVAEMCTQGQHELSVKERSLLSQAIALAFEGRGDREVFLSDVRRALEGMRCEEAAAHDLGVCLDMFVGHGPYAGFFDRSNEVDFSNPFVVFELGEVALRKDVAGVLLMVLLHSIGEVCAGRKGIQKYLIVDEAWTLLRSNTTARFIENVLRTYRKLNTAALMVTQQVSDFEGATGRAICANAPNRVFLRQTSETVLAMEKLLDLSPEEKALLATVTTVKGKFSEMLILSSVVKGVARLVPDPFTYWLFTTDPQDNAYLDSLRVAQQRRGAEDPLHRSLEEAAARFPHGVAAGENPQWKSVV